ncbi:MAG TPA: metallophosphoesterase [Chloroflexota bacterium]
MVHLDVRIDGLPAALDGFCLAHVSDLHVRENDWEAKHIAETASVIRRERPSLLLNSGDFLQGNPPFLQVVPRVTAILLPQEETPFRPANIAMLGNHDFDAGLLEARALAGQLRELGVSVPLNDVVSVSGPAGTIIVAGLTLALPRFREAADELRTSGPPRIALIHEPEVAEQIPSGSADLILAGHTHGAQISIPGLRRWAVKRYAKSGYVAGMYRINDMPLYVNRGLGTTGPPIRFGSAPEVTIIRLVR